MQTLKGSETIWRLTKEMIRYGAIHKGRPAKRPPLPLVRHCPNLVTSPPPLDIQHALKMHAILDLSLLLLISLVLLKNTLSGLLRKTSPYVRVCPDFCNSPLTLASDVLCEWSLYKIVKQREKQKNDIVHMTTVRNKNVKVLIGDNEVKDRWKEYFEELNIENETDDIVD